MCATKVKTVNSLAALSTLVKPTINVFTAENGMVVDQAEGLDMCIAKLMGHRRSMSISEIGIKLSQCGYERAAVKARVVALSHRDNFDRTGGGKETYYTLRKDSPLHKMLPKVKAAEKTVATSATPQQSVYPEAKVEVKQEPAVQQAAYAGPVAGEGIATSIWKLMSDRKEWSVAEVSLFLEDLGISKLSVVDKMSHLNIQAGWFNVTKYTQGRHGYVLKQEIPMPVGEPAYVRRKTKEKEETMGSKQSATSKAKLDAKASGKPVEPVVAVHAKPRRRPAIVGGIAKVKEAEVAGLSDKPASAMATPSGEGESLFSSLLLIKGQCVTTDEAKAILRKLTAEGFRAIEEITADVEELFSVKKTYTIRGVEFTSADAAELHRQLYAYFSVNNAFDTNIQSLTS